MASRNRKRAPQPETPADSELLDFDIVAAELVRALRGKRSQVAFSRRLGYTSSVAHRWEAGRAWPWASALLEGCERIGIDLDAALTRFFQRRPGWLDQHALASRAGIAAFLRQLRGKTPISRLAEASGINRYSLARWLAGSAEPRLPDFLRVIEAASRRVVDFLACLVDPARLPAVAERWQRLEQLRHAAYEYPLSHAVLRALELAPELSRANTSAWLEQTLGMRREEVTEALHVLERTGQVRRVSGAWRPERTAPVVNTSADPERARAACLAWTRLALERLEARAPGHYGYSVFAIGKADLRKLRDLHVEYLRAMLDLIAGSRHSECVAVYASQLLDLSAGPSNALSPQP